jgi:L-asparaginase
VSPLPKLLFLFTGGTLSMRKVGDPGHLAPTNLALDLLAHAPALSAVADIQTRVITNVDSSDLTPSHWGQLAQAIAEAHEEFDGFVVIHGTDTMTFTACALSFMLGGDHKPVVLTGSQRPLAVPRTDARSNLVHSAISAAMNIREVGLYFGSHLFRGNRATKTSVYAYDAFASPNHPPLVELGVDIERVSPALRRSGPVTVHPEVNTDVAVLSAFPGMAPNAIDALTDLGKRVIMLRGFGEGNLPLNDWPETIRRATDSGVHVLVGSQCRAGASRPGRYAGSDAARDAGAIYIGDMTGEAAVVKSMCLLGRGVQKEDFQDALLSPLAGEITPGSASRL